MGVTTAHKWLNLDDDQVGIYNAWDTYATARIVQPLTQELKDNGQWDYFQDWFTSMAPVVHAMWQRGAGCLDKEAKTKYRRALRKELKETEDAIRGHWPEGHGYTDKFFNSPKQRASFLYDDLNLRAPPKTHKRSERSTDQSSLIFNLEHLRRMDERHVPVLHNLFHRSRLNTIDTRYLTVEEENGRVRPTIKLPGAETGRLAYAGPPLQQWPEECRHLLVAASGCVFVAADYKQLEARIMAHLSQDLASIEVFEAGDDIHRQNCQDLFGYTNLEWEDLDHIVRAATRDFAKRFIYGTSYGGTAETMSQKLFCPCSRCVDKVPAQWSLSRKKLREVEDRWSAKHAIVLTWRDDLVRSVVQGDHTWTSPFGYRRFFFTPYPAVKTEIYNCPMQHCAAKIVERAMIDLHRLDAPLVLQMHDALKLEVPISEADRWAGVLQHVMEQSIPELGGVSFPVDVKVGVSWGKLSTWTGTVPKSKVSSLSS